MKRVTLADFPGAPQVELLHRVKWRIGEAANQWLFETGGDVPLPVLFDIMDDEIAKAADSDGKVRP